MLRRNFIHFVSSLGIDCVHFFDQGQSVARNGSALAPNKVVQFCLFSLSQNALSGSLKASYLIKYKNDGSFNYPRDRSLSLLVLLLSLSM